MEFSTIIGYVAAALTTGAFFPQAIKVYKTNHTKDISIGMFLLLTIGIFLWLVYGIILYQMPIILANSITLCLAGYILYKKIKIDH